MIIVASHLMFTPVGIVTSGRLGRKVLKSGIRPWFKSWSALPSIQTACKIIVYVPNQILLFYACIHYATISSSYYVDLYVHFVTTVMYGSRQVFTCT